MTPKATAMVAIGSAVAAAGLIVAGLLINGPAGPAPPGWNYCVDPSYYTRRCESTPMSQRWSGTPGCSSIAICGNHAAQCGGIDGLTYPIIGQFVNGSGDRYPKPADSAGLDVIASWEDCYLLHKTTGGGNRGGCATAAPLPGRLTYTVLTWTQLPPGPQKTAWGAKYGCASTTPSPVPTPVVTPGCVPVTVTPQTICVTPATVNVVWHQFLDCVYAREKLSDGSEGRFLQGEDCYYSQHAIYDSDGKFTGRFTTAIPRSLTPSPLGPTRTREDP